MGPAFMDAFVSALQCQRDIMLVLHGPSHVSMSVYSVRNCVCVCVCVVCERGLWITVCNHLEGQ